MIGEMRFGSLRLMVTVFLALACACAPRPGPDKTVAGAVLGAAWGAGAGAVIGHQLTDQPTGEGAAIGAGFGLVSGAISGMSHDAAEGLQLAQERQLASLRIQTTANAKQMAKLQSRLDYADTTGLAGIYQVYFDVDATSLRLGAVSNLETMADNIKLSPRPFIVNVVGHTDDAGSPEYNERLAEARARNVAAYLAARGISSHQIKVSSAGAKQPVATNSTPIGRQLNRRVEVFLTFP